MDHIVGILNQNAIQVVTVDIISSCPNGVENGSHFVMAISYPEVWSCGVNICWWNHILWQLIALIVNAIIAIYTILARALATKNATKHTGISSPHGVWFFNQVNLESYVVPVYI